MLIDHFFFILPVSRNLFFRLPAAVLFYVALRSIAYHVLSMFFLHARLFSLL